MEQLCEGHSATASGYTACTVRTESAMLMDLAHFPWATARVHSLSARAWVGSDSLSVCVELIGCRRFDDGPFLTGEETVVVVSGTAVVTLSGANALFGVPPSPLPVGWDAA
jgi:hypothetical protein